MQRTYNRWREEAMVFNGVTTDELKKVICNELLAGKSILINDTLLIVDNDNSFITLENPDGSFIHAQNHLGLIDAPSKTVSERGILSAIEWAEKQLTYPDAGSNRFF